MTARKKVRYPKFPQIKVHFYSNSNRLNLLKKIKPRRRLNLLKKVTGDVENPETPPSSDEPKKVAGEVSRVIINPSEIEESEVDVGKRREF